MGRTLLLVVTAAAILLAGCGPTEVPDEIDSAELDLLHTAEQVLLRDCMRQAGFEIWISPREPVPESREFPYGVDDVSWARRHGYGSDIERELTAARENDPNQRYFQSLPPERRAAALIAANGERPEGLTVTTPDGGTFNRSDRGCQTEAERQLYGDVAVWFRVVSTVDALDGIRTQRVLADARYTEAVRPWAECMRIAGRPYASPADLRTTLAPAMQSLSRHEEISLAVTEATCAHSSGLAATAAKLDRQHGNDLRRQNQSDVDTLRRVRQDALPRARDLVESAGVTP